MQVRVLFCFLVASLWALPGQAQDADFIGQMRDEFADFTRQQTDEYEAFAEAEREAFAEFKREIREMWGDETVSTKKDWVEYSPDRESRSVVDFESDARLHLPGLGEVLTEVLQTPRQPVDNHPDAGKT